jgi:hypothetical protein
MTVYQSNRLRGRDFLPVRAQLPFTIPASVACNPVYAVKLFQRLFWTPLAAQAQRRQTVTARAYLDE